MTSLKYLERTRLPGTGFELAQGVRAGAWLFFTGHEATDFQHGLAPSVAGKSGLQLGGAPRHRREGDYLIQRFQKLITAEGGDMRHIVRVDQFYPTGASVNGYQRARKAAIRATAILTTVASLTVPETKYVPGSVTRRQNAAAAWMSASTSAMIAIIPPIETMATAIRATRPEARAPAPRRTSKRSRPVPSRYARDP